MTETQIKHLAIWTYFKVGSMTYIMDDRIEAAFWAGFMIAKTEGWTIGHPGWRRTK